MPVYIDNFLLLPVGEVAPAGLDTDGKALWRVPVRNFTPWDFNWPWGFPPDATPPIGGDPATGDERKPYPCGGDTRIGCVIDAQAQVLGEDLAIVGTPYTLHYRSDRSRGRKTNYTSPSR